jgi:hypothetical protein
LTSKILLLQKAITSLLMQSSMMGMPRSGKSKTLKSALTSNLHSEMVLQKSSSNKLAGQSLAKPAM